MKDIEPMQKRPPVTAKDVVEYIAAGNVIEVRCDNGGEMIGVVEMTHGKIVTEVRLDFEDLALVAQAASNEVARLKEQLDTANHKINMCQWKEKCIARLS